MATFSISGPGSKPEGTGGGTPFVFTVTRDDASAVGIVDYYMPTTLGAAGTASDQDFVSRPTGSVYFAAGQLSKTFTVNVSGDSIIEPDESFRIALSNPRGGTIAVGTAEAEIVNDDGAETPSPASYSFSNRSLVRAEGDSGTTPFTFVVNRSGDTSGSGAVNYNVFFSTTNSTDFASPLSGVLTFAAGELSKELTILVRGDAFQESDEQFIVGLEVGGSFATNATGTIVNDDGTASATAVSVSGGGARPEGTGQSTMFDFVVTRSGDLTAGTMVDYFLTPNTGQGFADAADFVGRTAGTVSFAAGESSKTVRIEVAGDATQELDEDFSLGISNARGATIETATAAARIQNDDGADPPAVRVTWGTASTGISKYEGTGDGVTAFTYVVNRSGDVSGETRATYTVGDPASGQPANAADFAGPTTGTITFAPGELSKEITLLVNRDALLEGDERFTLRLSDAPGATLPAPIPGQILDDDAGGQTPGAFSVTGTGGKAEGTGEGAVFVFTVNRAGDASNAAMVDYFLLGQTNSADFTGITTSTLYFAAGETSQVVRIQAAGDAVAEPDESFTFNLSNARGAAINSGSAPGQILDDDGWISA